jgi:signal transduction histidine kinase
MNFSSLLAIIKKVEPGKTGFAFLMQQDSKFSIFDPSFKSRKKIKKIEDISGGINYYNSGASKLIYAYCPIKAYSTQKNKWFLVVQEPVNEAFEVSMALRNYVIILLMISTIIIIVFAFISADKITKPFSIMNRDLKNMNKKVNEMSEELKKSAIRAKNLESLAAMSAGLAHEIRNPLTSIKGYAQFIKSEIGSSSELKEDITVIIDEVDRLNKITERFLSFARPEKPDLSSNDINDIIIESVKAIKKEIDQNNINICMELNGVPKTMLDKEQMEQVIINIIINSVQAMGKDGNISISTSFIKEFNMVQVSISDTGGGIKKEDQDKVFEPFYTTKDKGTGLGLAICSRIIENHDGYIDFKSREGEGTVFLIKLPAIED